MPALTLHSKIAIYVFVALFFCLFIFSDNKIHCKIPIVRFLIVCINNIFDGLHFALWVFIVHSLLFIAKSNKNTFKCILTFQPKTGFFCFCFFLVCVSVWFLFFARYILFCPCFLISSKAFSIDDSVKSYHMFLKCAARDVYF